MQFGNVEQFAWRPVGLGCIPDQVTLKSYYLADQFRQFANGNIFAATDINDLCAIIFLEQEEAGRGQIVDVKKFPPRSA